MKAKQTGDFILHMAVSRLIFENIQLHRRLRIARATISRTVRVLRRGNRDAYHIAMDRDGKVGLGQWLKRQNRRAGE